MTAENKCSLDYDEGLKFAQLGMNRVYSQQLCFPDKVSIHQKPTEPKAKRPFTLAKLGENEFFVPVGGIQKKEPLASSWT